MDLGLGAKRALVTGGTKGIGRAIVEELLAEGADVSLCARNADEVSAAQAELRARFGEGRVHCFKADVTDPAAVDEYVSTSAKVLGGIDIVVNNAGAAHPGNFETLSDEDWRHDLDVKLFSQIRVTRAALAHLRTSTQPRVINVNAVFAKYPDPAFFATSVIRAACVNLNKVLAQQYGPEGILVNGVNIGLVETPQWENIHRRRAPDLPFAEFLDQAATGEVPLGRFGQPQEVAGLVAFLAGSRSSYITGAMIDVAGGMGKYT